MVKRREKSGHSVDWKHPYGGAAEKLHFPSAKRKKSCPEKLHTPTVNSTFDKIIFHVGSMSGGTGNYAVQFLGLSLQKDWKIAAGWNRRCAGMEGKYGRIKFK